MKVLSDIMQQSQVASSEATQRKKLAALKDSSAVQQLVRQPVGECRYAGSTARFASSHRLHSISRGGSSFIVG